MDRVTTQTVVDHSKYLDERKFDNYIDWQGRWRRVLFFGLTLASAVLATLLMFDIFQATRLTPIEILGLGIFGVLFLWIAGSFWTAVAGFIVQLRGHDTANIHCHITNAPLKGRTAIVMPIYNEDVQRVLAGLNATWKSLLSESAQQSFDLFILSDTRDAEIAAQELAAWHWLCERYAARGRIFYRRRAQNVDQKSGNIANFIRSWGAAYNYMIVLDADSVMSGSAIVSLARMMDTHPQVGIIQALPLPMGSSTLFGRMLQFSSRLNGPMLASGLAFWQLGHSNYWGHNAIVRTRAFAEHCALPRLSGTAPFGGNILSHDFVEAAFMRRAGYQVWMLPNLQGSWEGIPSNLFDYAARDRRWVQGNLQHSRLLPMHGLHWLSRVHFLTGIMSYLSSTLWLLLLLLSSFSICLQALQGHLFFEPHHYMLFPNWPQNRSGEIAMLLSVTLIILFLPKVLGALLAYKNSVLRTAFGGGIRLMLSVLLELALSMLFAPTMMLIHTDFVVLTLLGKSISWNVQTRSDRRITLGAAIRYHSPHVIIAALWSAIILLIVPKYLVWLLPALLGLLISIPFSMLTSHENIGQKLRQRGLLLTPEETMPPSELRVLEQMSFPITSMHVDVLTVPPLAPLRMEPEAPANWKYAPVINTNS